MNKGVKPYIGEYLCLATDPINTVFLVTEEYFPDKLFESLVMGILRKATFEEVQKAKEIGRLS